MILGQTLFRSEPAKSGRGWDRAITALLTEPTLADAARQAHTSERTLRRRVRDPQFQEAYKVARYEAFHTAICQLQAASSQAVATLRAALTDEHGSTRVRAAIAILELGRDLGGFDEINERLAVLEQRLGMGNEE
jgi:hypothetical protein